jgi:hypothetical protein
VSSSDADAASGRVAVRTGSSSTMSGNVELSTGAAVGSATSGDITMKTGIASSEGGRSGNIMLESSRDEGASSDAGKVMMAGSQVGVDASQVRIYSSSARKQTDAEDVGIAVSAEGSILKLASVRSQTDEF